MRHGAHHHLGLGHFGAGQAGRAEVELAAANPHSLVRFRVRTQTQIVLARVVRHALEVAFEDVEIHHQGGRIDFGDMHINRIE